MLYRIEAVCIEEMDWIVELQRDLLTAVCNPAVTGADVNVEWLIKKRPDEDRVFVEILCARKKNKKAFFLPLLQKIANGSPQDKQTIQERFQYNINFYLAFEVNTPPHHLRTIGNSSLDKALKEYLESFYSPGLQKGYGFPLPGRVEAFTRGDIVNAFHEQNRQIGVCVFCDSDLDDPDLDHFYSKSDYPELSCHPANLVAICKTCNSRGRKGVKKPFDESEPDPMLNWYHPYFRCAEGHYTVDFVLENNRVQPVLTGDSALDQTRLDKLTWLVGLDERWRDRLAHIVRTTIKQLRHSRNIQAKLVELADSAQDEIAELPWSLLKSAYCREAAKGNGLLWEEIRIEMEDFKQVTGT
ncbi:MAG: hypothetical protein GY862_03255 [Gammaproteobacteria bacterium]|nr:hypothetical protein [Gammaproteobacteria bacterium]